jgi:hypothetical protein
MPRKPRRGECVYCGTVGDVTRDHVPPKCLFSPDARTNLITVAACPSCHGQFKRDDEYFRIALSIRSDLPSNVSGTFLRQQTKRTLNHPQAADLRAMLRRSSVMMPIRSPDGSYLGHAPALKLEAARIVSTCERIVKGLYSHYLGCSLPKTHLVSVNLLDMQHNSSAIRDPQVQELFVLLGQFGLHHTFGSCLEVRYLRADDDPLSTFWFIRLHGVFGVIAFTEPAAG